MLVVLLRIVQYIAIAFIGFVIGTGFGIYKEVGPLTLCDFGSIDSENVAIPGLEGSQCTPSPLTDVARANMGAIAFKFGLLFFFIVFVLSVWADYAREQRIAARGHR